jgi:hypothetical protein
VEASARLGANAAKTLAHTGIQQPVGMNRTTAFNIHDIMTVSNFIPSTDSLRIQLHEAIIDGVDLPVTTSRVMLISQNGTRSTSRPDCSQNTARRPAMHFGASMFFTG